MADVDIARARSPSTRRTGKQATVTAVPPPGRFGALEIATATRCSGFSEKPPGDSGWINGGFFVLQPKVLDRIDGDDTIWEHEPLERLAADGELMAYRHDGFWQPMDTLRDKNHAGGAVGSGAGAVGRW